MALPSCQPFLQVRRDKGIVAEIGMLAADAVDLMHLARAQAFGGIEAPDAGHQALPAQDLVAACDAAMKIVGDVKEGTVAISDAGIECQEIGGHARFVARGFASFELL